MVRTDDDGRFAVEGLAPGTLLLKVEAEGYAAWYRRDLALLVDAPAPVLGIELESTWTIRGRVVSDGDGGPLVRVFVYARERGTGDEDAPDPGGAAQDGRNEHVRRRDVPAGARGVDFRLDPVPTLDPPR